MDKNFYYGLEARIEAGQYTMAEITAELDKRLGQGRITDEDYAKLLALAEVKIDNSYNGNKMPTNYDLEQDIKLSDHDLSIVELFELVLLSSTTTQISKMSVRIPEARSISNSYVRLIVAGTRTFSSVPDIMRQEVADKLIKMGREDLIDVPEFLPPVPPEEILPVDPEVPQA